MDPMDPLLAQARLVLGKGGGSISREDWIKLYDSHQSHNAQNPPRNHPARHSNRSLPTTQITHPPPLRPSPKPPSPPLRPRIDPVVRDDRLAAFHSSGSRGAVYSRVLQVGPGSWCYDIIDLDSDCQVRTGTNTYLYRCP